MSELARNDQGDEWTAHELRDDYLRTGHAPFAWWVCAYCDVELTPAAVYGTSFKKRPYFRLLNSSLQHAADCPHGDVGFGHYGITVARPQAHQFDVDLPEKLVPARQPARVRGPSQNKPVALADPVAIRRRVDGTAAAATIANQYTTSLLKTLVDARKEALAAIFALPHIAAMPRGAQPSAAFAMLKAIPLEIYRRPSNYNDAFHKTNHKPWSDNYIYHGRADVSVIPGGYELRSHDRIPNPTPTAAPLLAVIRVICDRANPVNRMEARMMDKLDAASGHTPGKHPHPVSWCAYGKLALDSTGTFYELTVTQPDHIAI
ncbi:hypothetical protein KTE26_21990 [Ralstonia mannitolilytica]|uniref:hypothetical protein n=1 Tax=Ralstonia mannitolilytica TaxID=105219 RepID=UPI001315125D|nr:hypothetical protein [Ralstonia mannitolilytica]MBU9581109.1 hypothetical protein [Ralstonia mannitolilytica]